MIGLKTKHAGFLALALALAQTSIQGSNAMKWKPPLQGITVPDINAVLLRFINIYT